MTLDEHYICQRAANAIISEIGPFRVSTDALQAINQFLDEFIVLLLTCSLSLDLSQIKSVVFSLLPSTLGKNAIVEAELEVKTFTETESIDYELYERMRGLDSSKFPLEEAVPLLREKCFEYCTLADKDDQMYLQKSIRQKRNEATMKVIISPIVAIYVTTVMEHIAEYLLTAVAMTAEHEETDYVRVKEVFLALIDDIQLGDVFHRMDLRDKMEKRAGLNAFNRPRSSYLPPPSPSPNNNNRKSYNTPLDQQQNHETGSFLDITFDDLDLEYFEDNPRKSTASRIPDIVRPQSAMSMSSNYTTNTAAGNRKSTFHLFKNNRNSFSGGDVPPRADSPVYDPDAGGPSNMNFDDLIKSGGTVKVSLTPNRLRSIETKDELSPPPLTWERRSTSSPRLSAVGSTNRPSSPLVRQNTSNSVRTTHSTNSKKSAQSSHTFPGSSSTSGDYDHTIEVPKINARPSTPSSPLSKKSFSVSDKTRFENPRDAPLPPPMTPLSPTIPVTTSVSTTVSTPIATAPVVSSANTSISSPTIMKPPSGASTKLPTPLPKLPTTTPVVSYVAPKSTIPSTHSSDSISSEISSVQSIPSPITSTPPVVPDNLTTTTKTTAISIEEPPVPRPTKSIPLNGIVIRRSSVSNKKSRDNLRRSKEEQQQQNNSPLVDEPVPTMVIDTTKATVEQQPEEKEEQQQVVLTEEPNQINERQVHFDTVTTDSPTTTTTTTTTTTSPTSSSDENNSLVGAVVSRKKAATLSPERPSSMVAKRASMVGNNRRRSLHESYATEKYHQDVLRQRGSVSVSIKQWDDILKPEDNKVSVIPPAAHRRSVLRQLRQQQLQEQLQLQQDLLQQQQSEGTEKSNGLYMNANASNSNAVLDKVLKFERASSLDDVAHQRVSHMPRRERFLYLQQDPSAIERKSTVPKKVVAPAINVRRVGIDQGVQTDAQPITPPSSFKKADQDENEHDDEHGLVDGDEEWFLQDDEWDEQEETAIVEWLLGE